MDNAQTKVVRQFRGISQYKNLTNVPMEHARSLLNVFVGSSGALEKVRLPFALTDPLENALGDIDPDTIFDFQQADGTRQLVLNAGNSIGYYTVTSIGGVEQLPYNFNLILDSGPLAGTRWSWIDSNNVLYGANGQIMRKWDGANWHQMGIGNPGETPPAPSIGVKVPLSSIQRAGNVVTWTLGSIVLPAGTPPTNFSAGWAPNALATVGAGIPVIISGVTGGGAGLNGGFVATAPPAMFQGTYAQVGGNIGPFNNNGFITIPYLIQQEPSGASQEYKIANVSRVNGKTTVILNSTLPLNVFVGDRVTVAGLTGVNATANGNFVAETIAFNPGVVPMSFTYTQVGEADLPVASPVGATIAVGPTNVISGRTWRYAYANSALGIVGPASDPSPVLPGGGVFAKYRAFLTAPASTDPQVDQIWWFATGDGGGDYELVRIANVQPGGGLNILGDAVANDSLDETQQAPLINFAPPIGSKLGKWQGRIFLSGIVGDPTAIAYSAYEQYLVGTRPEEAWFPNNRLRLPTGADPIQAFGVILPGVVAFSRSNKMFMFKGQVEDITTTLPVNFSAVLEELPWQTGAVSHQALQPTPYGIVWVASDLTVKIWNGIFYGEIIGPRDLSQNIYPIMRRITPGTEPTIQSAFFNFVERDWFVISVCLDGEVDPNYLLFFDLAQDANDNLGVFIAQPTIPIRALGTREDANGGRHLIMGSGPQLYELRVASEMVNGIITNPAPSTAGTLTAYWESGLVGSDAPSQMKMFRWGRLLTDTAAAGFGLVAKLIDDDTYTLQQPLSKALKFIKQKFTVNFKARRCGLVVTFPSADASVAVQEVSIRYIPGGEY